MRDGRAGHPSRRSRLCSEPRGCAELRLGPAVPDACLLFSHCWRHRAVLIAQGHAQSFVPWEGPRRLRGPTCHQPCALMRNCSILTCDRRRRERALSVSERAHVSKHGPQARRTVSLQCLRCCPRSQGPRLTPPAGNSSASCIWLRRRGKAPLKAPLPPSTAQPLAPVSCADAPQTVALTRVNSDCSRGQGPLALDPVYHTA